MRCSDIFLLFAGLALAATPVGAATIDFEDRPAANDPTQSVTEEYADLGVHFASVDDAATWGGMSRGDPGNWQIDGSNGPTFLGFDGRSYTAVVNFDEPVQELQLDVARADGAYWPDDFFMLVGFRDAAIVDVVLVHLGDVNSWTTVSMSPEVDRLWLYGLGFPGFRFGVDNLRWLGDENVEVLHPEIDIRPGSDVNPVNLRSRGALPVAVYGSDDFDVTQIDPSTLAFGPGEAGLAHRNGPHFEDVNADGRLDLMLHFRMVSAGIGSDDVEACLKGFTWDGVAVEGCDGITPSQGGRPGDGP